MWCQTPPKPSNGWKYKQDKQASSNCSPSPTSPPLATYTCRPVYSEKLQFALTKENVIHTHLYVQWCSNMQERETHSLSLVLYSRYRNALPFKRALLVWTLPCTYQNTRKRNYRCFFIQSYVVSTITVYEFHKYELTYERNEKEFSPHKQTTLPLTLNSNFKGDQYLSSI